MMPLEARARYCSLVSYIRGQWSSARAEGLLQTAARPAVPRNQDTPSIIFAAYPAQRAARGDAHACAVARDATAKTTPHFWFHPRSVALRVTCRDLGSGRELTRQLKGATLHQLRQLPRLLPRLRPADGRAHESAMENFNQAIGIKEMGRLLNDFLRRHLLTRGDAQERIRDKITPAFANLESCYESI